ncbi:serine-rich adhesin for platelets-like, partial [Littorina saxatilis]|uniref:serine-rich adhesin for platelets-like n=1 Tax=Littorina saxatilis TaxID=31220 RepID=UPI0038B43687
MLTWQLSDGTYSTKTFTIIAVAPVLDAAAFAFNLTTTSPEFKAGTYPLGVMKTYTRATVALCHLALDVSGPSNVTFAFNHTTRTLSLTTIRTVTGGITFPVSFALSSLSTAGVPSMYETRINTTLVTIQPYRTISVTCNATELFYGPNTAISCTFALDAPPASGVVLQLSTRANTAVTSTPNAAPFVGSNLTFVFSPAWATHTFADVTSQTINLAVADTSRQYTPSDLTFTFLKRSLIRYTLALLDPSASFYRSVGAANQNPFIACVTASEINTVATINTTIPGVVTNVSSLSFVGTSQKTMCFEIRAPIATTLTFSLPVSASPHYTPVTNTLTVSVRNLETVSVTANATLLFVRQSVGITVTTSGSVASAGSLSISTSVRCGGVLDGAALQPQTPTVVDMAAITSTTITYKATAQCSPALVEVSVSGTSTVFNVSLVPSVAFNVRPLKTVSAMVSKSELYGGGVDRLDLWAAVSGLPEALGASLTLSIADTSSPSVMTLALTSLVFTSGSANRSTFATAAQVTTTVATSLKITFSDSAIAEYDLPPSLIFPINIRPIVNITFSLSFSPAVVYVSPNLKGIMTVTLPAAPSMGTVTVTPLFLAGSPTAVRFSPLSITLGAGQTSGKLLHRGSCRHVIKRGTVARIHWQRDRQRQAVSVSSLFDFTSSSAKTQQFTVEALQPVGNITLTVSIVDGSANFDAPQPLLVDVRALDPITATGLAAGMYVGTTSVVTFKLQRSPQCSGSISVIPSFGSGDGAFAPAAGVTFLSGATSLSKSVVLTASQTSVGNVPVTLPVSGPCKSIFAAVSAATSTVRIYPRESVTISTLANMTDANDGSMFTYIGSAIPIIVDLGTPALRHTGVLVQLSFAGASGAISFSNSTVEFPPGVNRTTVYVTGLVDSTPADLSATVLVGTSIFIPTGVVKLKVLLRIPLTLTFDPSTQLIVVGNTIALTVTIGSAALVGTLQVRLDYQIAGGLNCTVAEFKAGATELTATVEVYGIQPAGPANLNVTLFGPAGAFYYATVPQFVTT